MKVHPGGNALYVADPDAVLDILTRRKDFRQPEFAKSIQSHLSSVLDANLNQSLLRSLVPILTRFVTSLPSSLTRPRSD